MKNIHPVSFSEKSIAVLPFINMSTDIENEYFSDGITEEIINALANIQGLKVIARTSAFAFKGKNIDVREIGNQLGVKTILEGSVRKYKNKVRITSQLINSQDGTHIWSHNFNSDLKNIFEIQDEISLLIAEKIRENFGHFNVEDHLVKESTKDFDAYELFLKGRFQQLKWDEKSIKKAIEFYDLAIAKDPNFARAYYTNLQCYGLLAAWGYISPEVGFEKAILYFQKAREIDTQLPEYYQSFVGKYFWGDWNFKAAYDQIKLTLNIYPNYNDALEAMSELHIATGFFDYAEKYMQKALYIDPLSANHIYTLANINYMQKNYEEAISLLDEALKINSELVLAADLKGMCLLLLNKKDEFNNYILSLRDSRLIKILFEFVNEGGKDLDKETLKNWKNVFKDQKQLVPYELFILANSNHKKEALELLKKYVELRRGQIINFRFEPLLKPLHQFDEFEKIHISNFVHENSVKNDETKKPPKVNDNELIENHKTLLEFIKKEKPYLDSQLSLRELADSISIHPNKLSYLINEYIGKNFNEFINQFRLDYFKQLIQNPKNNNLTILALAYESGFNSKTVFNSFFKKVEGIPPGAWLKSLAN